jgi:hypothetical protein
VKSLVLRNLSLRDLACAASTCHEFKREFSSRLAKERARLVSLGEETYGKKMFSGIVRAFQKNMRDSDAYPALVEWNVLSVNANGEVEYPESREMVRKYESGGPRVSMAREFGDRELFVVLYWRDPGSGKCAKVVVYSTTGDEGLVELSVTASREAAAAAAGFLFAICAGDCELMPACWQGLLDRTWISFGNEVEERSFASFLWSIAEKEEAGGFVSL